MHSKNAVVLVVDRLSASYLGPYGNTWIDTPELNRLAGESTLFEFALSNSPYLTNTYDSYWTGDAGFSVSSVRPGTSLPAEMRRAGIQTILVSDDSQVIGHPLAGEFGQHRLVEHAVGAIDADVMQTRLARTFAAAVETLAGAQSPYLLWIHADGLDVAWDAPYEYRQQFADEDDPPPPDFVRPPSTILSPDYDPDDLWGYARAYAGQILVLDACCGALMDALKNSEHAESTLLIFTSPRGYPMGEHLRVGACEPALYSELLHVPWLIRHPSLVGGTVRRQALVQPCDVYATLWAWFERPLASERAQGVNLLSPASDAADTIRPYSLARLRAAQTVTSADTSEAPAPADEIAIRTPQWFYRRSAAGNAELYVKPDDRYEANEVAARCSDILADFEQLVATLESRS